MAAVANVALLLALLATVNGLFLPAPIFDKNDLKVGENSPKDDVLLEFDVYHSGYIMPHTTNIVYPAEGRKRDSIIKYIELTDKIAGGKGGTARVVAGGVGYDFVHIKITSAILSKVNTRILVKGHEKPMFDWH